MESSTQAKPSHSLTPLTKFQVALDNISEKDLAASPKLKAAAEDMRAILSKTQESSKVASPATERSSD